jgi:hypothetical protein
MMHERQPFAGALLSRSYLTRLANSERGIPVSGAEAQAVAAIWREASRARPGAATRALADVFAGPMARLLGFEVRGFRPAAGLGTFSVLAVERQGVATAWVTHDRFDRARRGVVVATAAAGVRWAMSFDGVSLALVDCARPHARRFLAADVAPCVRDPKALRVMWNIISARALARAADGRSALETMIAESEAELRGARAALQDGVERAALTLTDALARRSARGVPGVERLFEEALTVVYRVLFLQFAEARGLVPVWHPTYRRAYTVEALREQIERDGQAPGAWEALQAMARLAHRGARAGELVVVPFNGRLFSPSHAPAVATRAIPDRDAAAVVGALTLGPEAQGRRERFPFVDLGVEQLGSIYERVLDFAPERDAGTGRTVLRRGTTRKNTGSFYTPRPLTELLVRRTLQPLVADRTPGEILGLRVLDPAMGSGAFLVAACRFLATAYESSLQRAGVAGADDFSRGDRAGFRRLVAQHCLFGVDINPMAVQLGRLSLWLCSLASDRPLTFLDHRLRVGNSLVGASLEDVSMRAPGRRAVAGEPTLFAASAMESIGRAIGLRARLDAIPDDSIDEVRAKEALCAELDSSDGPIAVWRTICDAWCAPWFWNEGAPPGAREFGAICAAARGDDGFGHPAIREWLARADGVARAHRFFHWPLEFPDVLSRPNGGFDAILGNPPWEMVRGRDGTRQLLRFTRDSGVYRLQSAGHANASQLFLERGLKLLRAGGRLGMILPWGVAADEGSARLRQELLDRCSLDELIPIENTEGLFPIHRALKFVALCATASAQTHSLRMRPPVRDIGDLDRIDSEREERDTPRIELSRDLLERLSAGGYAVPHVAGRTGARLLEFLLASAPAAASPKGWGLRFGRELNATEDRPLMSEGGDGYAVIAGRHVRAFHVAVEEATLRIEPSAARERLGESVLRHRLAYRDVSGAGNRMTLIAAIVPPRVVTTHTVFCLKTRVAADERLYLCALLNSYVANYFVRTRVGTHVTTGIIGTLPLPRPSRTAHAFARIVSVSRDLAAAPDRRDSTTQLQAEVAALYGLDEEMLEAILATFPLVPAREREAVITAFRDTRGV